MKFRMPLLVALIGSVLLMPAVCAEGQMSSPLGMDEEFQRRLAPVEAPPAPTTRPEVAEQEQIADENTAMENASEAENTGMRELRHERTTRHMEQCYETETNAWQDKVYYDAQERSPKISGILRAPEQKLYSPDHKVYGTATCYKGNTAQWLQGTSAPLGRTLPTTQTGLLAINGGYTGPAGSFNMPGGFNGGGASSVYSNLPATASSVQVELNVAQ